MTSVLEARVLKRAYTVRSITVFRDLRRLLITTGCQDRIHRRCSARRRKRYLFVRIFPYPITSGRRLNFKVISSIISVINLRLVRGKGGSDSVNGHHRGDSYPVYAIASTGNGLIAKPSTNTFRCSVRFNCFPYCVFMLRYGSFMIYRNITVPIFGGTLFCVVSRPLFLFRSTITRFDWGYTGVNLVIVRDG